jgi:bifunctional DNA-binding transcriptional regulator/antitoxin component of YhaV-PrlF toxin-antitoxin module
MNSKDITAVADNGSIELPEWFRQKYDIQPGDEMGILETEAGLLIAPRVDLINQLLDQIGAGLQAKGITLDDLMDSGRAIRCELLMEDYGIDAGEIA